MADDNSVTLNFKATGLSDVERAKETLKGYRQEVDNAKTAGNASAQSLNEQLAKLAQKTVAQELGKQFGQLAIKTNDETTALKGLTEELDKLKLSNRDIAAAGNAFNTAKDKALAFAAAEAEAELKARELAKTVQTVATAAEEVHSISPLSEDIGSGGNGNSPGGLSALGSKIRSLPSIQIPGAGVGTDAIGNVLRVFGAIPGVTLPVVAAFGALAAGIVVLNKVVPDLTSGIQAITARDKEYYEARVKGTKDSINALIEAKQFEQKVAQARLDDLAFVAKGYEEVNNKLGGFLGGIVSGVTEIAGVAGAANFKGIRDARVAYDEAKDSLAKANKEIDLYSGLVNDSGVAANDAAEALKKFNDQLGKEIIKGVELPLEKTKEVNEFLAKATTEQLEDKRKVAQADLDLTEAELVQLILKRNAQDESSQAYQDLDAEIAKLNDTEFGQLLVVTKLGDATADATAKENDLIEVRKQQVESTKKYNEDVKKNQDDLNKGLADNQQKYNDQLVAIAEQGAKAAAAALQKLVEKEADLATAFGDAETDAAQKAQQQATDERLKYQQEEAKAAKDHANALLKIQQDAKEREFELVLNRDFAGLFNSKRQTTDAMNAENQKYNDEEQARATSYANQQALDAEHYQQEEEQRQLNYQRQIAQAQLAYTREQQTLDKNFRDANTKAYTAYTNEQTLLQSKYNSQLTQLNSAITAELQLEAQGNTAKLALEAQYYAQSQQLIQGIYSNGGSTSTGSGSGGGPLTPTQDFGGSLDIPRVGRATPTSGISSTNNSRSVNGTTVNLYITGGADSAAIARAAASAVQSAISDLIG